MANKEYNPIYNEAKVGPDSTRFESAMVKEMLTPMELDIFDLVVQTLKMMKVLLGIFNMDFKK